MNVDLRALTRSELEAASRSGCQAVYLGNQTALCRVLGRYMMYVDTRDLALTPHMLMNGFWESWVTVAMIGALKAGMVCVDGGANVGYYTLLMADLVGPGGHVYAIEPNEDATKLLRKSLEVNGMTERVTLVSGALAAGSGPFCFRVPCEHPSNAAREDVSGTIFPDEQSTTHVTKGYALDELVESRERVDLVKLDVEGSELAAWHGMSNIWNRSPGAVLIAEWCPQFYKTPLALPEAINALLQIASDGSLEPFNPNQKDATLWRVQETQRAGGHGHSE